MRRLRRSAGHIAAKLAGDPVATALDAAAASSAEPDLTSGLARIGSARHVGYVDSRAYERALTDLIAKHLGVTRQAA